MTAPEVTLRPIERTDLEFLRDLANDPEVRRNVVGWDWPLSLESQDRWFNAGIDTATTRRFVIESGRGEPVGLTGLWDLDWHNRSALTAIKLGGAPYLRGKGYGVSAIEALMEFAFRDVGLNRLYGSILAENHASRRLFVDKCGWVEEGVSRQHVWRDGEFRDLIQVGILREEYARSVWRQR